MTRQEFDRWLESSYYDLLKRARKHTNTLEDAQDALHAAIARVLAYGVDKVRDPLIFTRRALTSACSNIRVISSRFDDARARFSAESVVLHKRKRPPVNGAE